MIQGRPIRTALIGVSSYANQHYELLLRQTQRGEMTPVAAAIINQKDEAAKCERLRSLGCAIFEDYREMLRKWRGRIDLCMIPTGIPLHAPMTLAAIEAGCNVFVEKPLAGCLADGVAMCEAARRERKMLLVGFQRMYSPVTRRIRDMLVEGAIGEVKCCKSLGMLCRDDRYFGRNNWAGRLKAGDAWVLDSPFNNAVAHFLMLMRFFAGPLDHDPEPVRVEAELFHARDIDSADTAAIRIGMHGFAPIVFLGSHCGRVHREAFAVVRGTRGEVRWEPYTTPSGFSERVIVRRAGMPDEVMETEFRFPLRDTMILNVCASLRGEPADVCTGAEALAHTRCVQMIHDSAPVRAIPPGFLARAEQKGVCSTVIPGIDEAMARAFEEEKLLSEIGIPWA
jgi:predicted dehydrogenase